MKLPLTTITLIRRIVEVPDNCPACGARLEGDDAVLGEETHLKGHCFRDYDDEPTCAVAHNRFDADIPHDPNSVACVGAECTGHKGEVEEFNAYWCGKCGHILEIADLNFIDPDE